MGTGEIHKDYLERSQRIKGMVLERPELVAKLYNVRDLKTLGQGGANQVLQLGNIGDVYIAIRRAAGVLGMDTEFAQANLEFCAQKYAECRKEGKRAPDFAIGVLNGRKPMLLTEDLTQGGKYRIENETAKTYGYLEPGHIECHYDFDMGSADTKVPSMFFAEENVIDLLKLKDQKK